MIQTRRFARAMNTVILAIAAMIMLGGCSLLPSQNAALSVTSSGGDRLRLRGDFDIAYYRYDDADAVTVVLIAGPEDSPTQAATIRLMWNPRAGKTPISDDATNATVQYVVFADRRITEGFYQEVGVYSGAGFMRLGAEPGSSQLTGRLRQADLLLSDRSERFKDLLGQSTLQGSFTARRDEQKVNQLLRQLNTRVTNRLGYPRLVRADD